MISLSLLSKIFFSATVLTVPYILISPSITPNQQHFVETPIVSHPYQKHYNKHLATNAPEAYASSSLLEVENFVYCPISSNMQSRLLSLIVVHRSHVPTDITTDNILALLLMYNYGTPRADFSILNGNKSAFAVIRDPIDRFISSFFHVCYRLRSCADPSMGRCGFDLRCLLIFLQNFNNIGGVWPQLGDFQFSPISHFIPQTYFCRFRQYKNKYRLFHYNDTDEFKSSISDYLVTNGMPKRLLESGWGNDNSSWLNRTGYRYTRELFKGQLGEIVDQFETINTIYQIYQLDYQFFNLPPPEIYVRKYCYLPQYRYHIFCRDALDK